MNTVTIRPVKIRRVCFVAAPIVIVFFVVLGALLSGPAGDTGAIFQRSDQIAMMALGLFIAAGILLFARPRIVADSTTIAIRNVIGGYELPWSIVREVRFERGSPWATLELADDDVVAVMALQATDKDHAVAGVRALRALLAEAHAPDASRP